MTLHKLYGMNFVALIGIVNKINKKTDTTEILLKVEKPEDNKTEIWYDELNISIKNNDFMEEISKLEEGNIIGVKGRIATIPQQIVIAERVQIF